MGFGIYWILTASLELLFAASSARVTKARILNKTEGCMSGTQSLEKCGINVATKHRFKILRKQMYSTPVGFTFPNVPNSYEVNMGYSPNVGFEPYWPGTTRKATTRRDYKSCGVICPAMYINYGPVCAVNKHNQYKSFISYCDMRNEDCVGASHWRTLYKGDCNSYIRTSPTKSADIPRRISLFITGYFNRIPTTPALGVAQPDNMRKHGLFNSEYKDASRNHTSHNRGPQWKRGKIITGTVRNKHYRLGHYRGGLHGNVGNHNGIGRKGLGQYGSGQKDRGQNGSGQKHRGQNDAVQKHRGQNDAVQKDRGQNGQSRKWPVGVGSHHRDKTGDLQARIKTNLIGQPSRQVPGRNDQKRKDDPHRGNRVENAGAHNVSVKRVQSGQNGAAQE